MKPHPTTSPIALVIADVDGTLVTPQKILTEKTRDAVQRLRDGGIRFAITSGRPPRGMHMITDVLKLDTPIAGFNGGVFVNPDYSVVASKLLTREAAEKTIEIIRAHQLTAWLYTPEEWYVPDANGPHVAREAWTVKFEAKICGDFGALLDNAVKIVGVGDDHDAVARCEVDCRAELGSRVSAARSQPYYLDVTHPEATKGGVVDYLSRALDIPEERIATIGDMPNDVLMFEKSGISVAMGNASAEVREQANFVTADNDSEGFALAMDQYVLRG